MMKRCAIDAVDGSSTRHVSAMDVGAVMAPTIQRSYPCKRLRRSVSTSRSRSGSDPVQAGLVSSLNRPGGNVTGVTNMGGGILLQKRVGLLVELLPSAARFA